MGVGRFEMEGSRALGVVVGVRNAVEGAGAGE